MATTTMAPSAVEADQHKKGTMKAAIAKSVGTPLVIEEVPIPTPSGRQLLVRVKVASLCHSDLSIIDGAFTQNFPITPGHEAVSVVEQLGPDTAQYNISIGDLVGAPLWENNCLACFECTTAGPQFCTRMGVKGLTSDGYFSEYTLVDAASAVVVQKAGSDAALPVAELSPVFCAGITVWDALERASLRPGDSIAIFGAGGLGGIAAQYAHALGYKVIVLDIRDEQLQVLQSAGIVDGIINTRGKSTEELMGNLLAINEDKAADCAIVTAPAVPAYSSAFNIVRAEGKIIAVGLPHEPIPMPTAMLTGRCISFIGAKVPGKQGAERCFNFTTRNKLYPKINPRMFKLEDINEMIELMRAGKIEDGRMVIQFF